MFSDDDGQLVKTLISRGYEVYHAADKKAALATVATLVGQGSVGFGGSMTSVTLGIPNALKNAGNEVYFHWDMDKALRPEILARAATADWYISSVNAITKNGTILNVDGTGNRVAALISGPKNVIYCIGRNKLVPDLAAAFERVRNVAAPMNAKRLNRNTPCAVTGRCMDCSSPDRICNMTSILYKKPALIESCHIILIDEELGY